MKSNTLKLSFAIFAWCSVLLLPNCSEDDTEPPKPEVQYTLKDRTVKAEPGKIVFVDELDMSIKDGDEARIINFPVIYSEASWAVPTVIMPAPSGEMMMCPLITYSQNGLTFDYSAFKVVGAVRYISSFDTPYYGFLQGTADDDASFITSIMNKDGKNYVVTTITQEFTLHHTNGCDSGEQTIVFECEKEIFGTLVDVIEISRTTTNSRQNPIPWVYESVNLFDVKFTFPDRSSTESCFSLSTDATIKTYNISSYTVKYLDVRADDFIIEELYDAWVPESPDYAGPITRKAQTTLKLGSAAENSVITFIWEDIAFRLPGW